MRTEKALYRLLSGGETVARAPRTVAQMVADLEERHGGRKGAAAAAGIGYSTWGHLKAGRHPSAASMARLTAAQRHARLTDERADELRRAPSIVIHARVKISSDDRTRPLRIGQWTDGMQRRRMDEVQSAIVDAWLRHDDATAAKLLEGVVESGLNLLPGSFGQHVDVRSIRVFQSEWAGDTWANSLGTTNHNR